MASVLVIDDDVDLIETYKLAIVTHGHQMRSAHSAEEARSVLKSTRPDLVVLDVMMETKFSGLALAREIHQNHPDLPIIMLTGVHQAADRAMHFEPDETWLPVARFIEKPVDPIALANEIDAMLTGG